MTLAIDFFRGEIASIEGSDGFGDDVLSQTRRITLDVSCSDDGAGSCLMDWELTGEVIGKLWWWLDD